MKRLILIVLIVLPWRLTGCGDSGPISPTVSDCPKCGAQADTLNSEDTINQVIWEVTP